MKPGVVAVVCACLAATCGESTEPAPAAELEPLPTLEQARAEAAAEIGPENADEEFERLKRELAAEQ